MSLPRSRWAIASTARSSRPRSCETMSAAPGKRASQPSSQSVASRSRWLVGSSSSSRSGLANSAVASATRIRQPPENVRPGAPAPRRRSPVPRGSPRRGRAPRRRRWRAAAHASRRAGAATAVSASASSARRSGSPCSTVSSRLASPEGASCFTSASRARAASRISPPSSGRSPAIARSRVDLPAPLRPTRPMRRPGVDRQIRAVQQRAAADADHEAGDGEQAHGARLRSPAGPAEGVAPPRGVI